MIYSILLLIVLIIINGIFSASELAFLSIDKIKLKNDISKNDKKAILINKILKDSSSFFSTIQIVITLSGFLASAFAADYFADYLLNIINVTIISKGVFRSILVILITFILSYFSLVFGELVPKKMAINNPYKIARRYASVINASSNVFYPLVKFLSISTSFICKIFKIKDKNNDMTEEDIKRMIILGREEGVIEEKEKEYILNVFKFNDIGVSKVMTPKKDVVMINIDDDIKKNVLKIKESKYTRFPVYKDNENNIIGVLNVKDLILHYGEDEVFKLEKIIRKVHAFKHDEKIDDVFRYMQEKNESICTVYKQNNFIGIVTIEDAVEEIVGNIYDEYDEVDYGK